MPFTCDFLHIHNAIESARKLSNHQSVIVVLIRESDLLGFNKAPHKPRFEKFVELIAWLTSQKDIQILSVEQATEVINDLSAHRFLTFNSYLKLSHYLYPLIPPQFFNKMFPLGVYLSSKTSEDIKNKIWMFILFFYSSIFIISSTVTFWGGSIIFPRFRFFSSICRYGSLIGLVLLSVYAFIKLNFSHYKLLLETSLYAYRNYYYKFVVLIVVLVGACIGIWISWIITKNNFIRSK
jgi:hypothetical protein